MMDNWEEAWEDYTDKVIERLGWVGAFLVVLGYYLNAQHHLSCWPVWIMGNTLVAGYSIYKKKDTQNLRPDLEYTYI